MTRYSSSIRVVLSVIINQALECCYVFQVFDHVTIPFEIVDQLIPSSSAVRPYSMH